MGGGDLCGHMSSTTEEEGGCVLRPRTCLSLKPSQFCWVALKQYGPILERAEMEVGVQSEVSNISSNTGISSHQT